MKKTVPELESDLRRMRRETADYSLDPHHDDSELFHMRSECANLWGAIECRKKGAMPVLASQMKYL